MIEQLIQHLIKRLKSISPLEMLVVILVAFLTIGLVRFFGKEQETRLIKVQVVGQDWTRNTVSYDGFRPPFWLAEKIKPGDVERGPDGNVLAEVVEVEQYERLASEFDVYIILKVRGLVNTKLGKLVYNGGAIEVGEKIELNLNEAHVVGQIIDDNYPKDGYVVKKLLVRAKKRGVPIEATSTIKEGSIMINQASGKKVAEVKEVDISPSSQVLLKTSGKGQLQLISDNELRDLKLLVSVLVEKHGGEWYFAGHQKIKVGNSIWLYLETANLTDMEIVAIEEVVGDK